MIQKHLRLARIIISVLFLFFLSSIFLDFRELVPETWYNSILFLQFVPSLFKFVKVLSIVALGFVVVLILTVLFGRVYCSTICPLGILQDFFIFLSRKFKIKRKHKPAKSYKILQYILLAIALFILLFNSNFIINLLDPYSIFGRIASDIFKPVLVGINNLLSKGLEKVHIYILYPVTYHGYHWATIWISLVMLAGVMWLDFYRGRLYCNTICPVGTFLGLVSKISIFKLKFDSATCTKCGKCSLVCKAGCIDFRNINLDFDRCIGCFNCIDACESNSIRYKFSFAWSAKDEKMEFEQSKREFISKAMLYGIGLLGFSQSIKAIQKEKTNENDKLIPEHKTYPVSPPGSKSLEHFKSSCTACHLCISVCPTGVIQPSFLEYGFTGMLQPRMDYHTNYCNYECTKCGEACPTGAIMSLEKETKKLTQIGRVHFELNNCVVYTDNTACGSCSEHCPTQAVRMVPYKDGLTIPEIHSDICIGCGACEYACPVRPYRAIYVDGNPVHKTALKPHFKELKVENQEEFPF